MLVWMCVLIVVNQLGFGAVIPVLPLYASTFGVSLSAVGLTIGIYGLARFHGADYAADPSQLVCAAR